MEKTEIRMYVCTKEDREKILSMIDLEDIMDGYVRYGNGNDISEVYLDDVWVELAGISGRIDGCIRYNVKMTDKKELNSGGYERDLAGYEFDDADLTLTDEEGCEVRIYFKNNKYGSVL